MIARKLTLKQLTDIRRRVNNGETQKSIADDYGLSALTATLHVLLGLEYAGYFTRKRVTIRDLAFAVGGALLVGALCLII